MRSVCVDVVRFETSAALLAWSGARPRRETCEHFSCPPTSPLFVAHSSPAGQRCPPLSSGAITLQSRSFSFNRPLAVIPFRRSHSFGSLCSLCPVSWFSRAAITTTTTTTTPSARIWPVALSSRLRLVASPLCVHSLSYIRRSSSLPTIDWCRREFLWRTHPFHFPSPTNLQFRSAQL